MIKFISLEGTSTSTYQSVNFNHDYKESSVRKMSARLLKASIAHRAPFNYKLIITLTTLRIRLVYRSTLA